MGFPSTQPLPSPRQASDFSRFDWCAKCSGEGRGFGWPRSVLRVTSKSIFHPGFPLRSCGSQNNKKGEKKELPVQGSPHPHRLTPHSHGPTPRHLTILKGLSGCFQDGLRPEHLGGYAEGITGSGVGVGYETEADTHRTPYRQER